ncbi:hypothetical protein JW935_06600, partial [candidate division KSB1 bacterium]|nr:hypothetical protein [candidate division KSB1 bacterium]
MKTHLFLAIISVFMAGLFWGCSEENKNNNPVTPIVDPNSPQISVEGSIELTGDPLLDKVHVSNKGRTELVFTIAETPEWLRVTPDTGYVSWRPSTITIYTDFSKLEYGDHTGTIKLQSNGGKAEIKVSLFYKAPELLVWRPILYMSRDFPEAFVVIQNEGGGQISWKLESKPKWLALSDTSGNVVVRPDTINLKAQFNLIPYGEYEDYININTNLGKTQILVYLTWQRQIEIFPGIGMGDINLHDSYYVIKKVHGGPDRQGYIEKPDKTFDFFVQYYRLGLTYHFDKEGIILYGPEETVRIEAESPYDGLTEN